MDESYQPLTRAEFKLPEVKKTKIVNERQSLIATAVEAINRERVGTLYKPCTGRGIAMKVAHVKTEELRDFIYSCTKTKCGFSKAFFGSLRVK